MIDMVDGMPVFDRTDVERMVALMEEQMRPVSISERIVKSQDISRAMDEIYRLRVLCAHTAVAVSNDANRPRVSKSRREAYAVLTDRLGAAARGSSDILSGLSVESSEQALEACRASRFLNWPSWLEEPQED